MSGTSLDGLDIALCRISGAGTATKVEVLHFTTLTYSPTYQQRVKAVFANPHAGLQEITLLNAWVGQTHGEMVKACLEKWQVNPKEIDVIASHGQTIFHSPKHQHQLVDQPNATLQIGDGDHIAMITGVTTISDFRQKHIAAGGEGAPLAAYGDWLYFSSTDESRILLNLGGIANLTFVPRVGGTQSLFSSDIGPANTLIDAYVQQHFPPQKYDENSTLAKQGTVNNPLLNALLAHPFFALALPKTTGQELFNLSFVTKAQRQSQTEQLSHYDVLATLTYFTATLVANTLNQCASQYVGSDTKQRGNLRVFISGGGIHNPLLQHYINQLTPSLTITSTAEIGIHPDAKEAVLFALLANETLAGSKYSEENLPQSLPKISMGKVSFVG